MICLNLQKNQHGVRLLCNISLLNENIISPTESIEVNCLVVRYFIDFGEMKERADPDMISN